MDKPRFSTSFPESKTSSTEEVRSRRSSILKQQRQRTPFEEITFVSVDEDYERKKRVSFAGVNIVKEFCSKTESQHIGHIEAYEETFSLSSDSSHYSNSIVSKNASGLQIVTPAKGESLDESVYQEESMELTSNSLCESLAQFEENPINQTLVMESGNEPKDGQSLPDATKYNFPSFEEDSDVNMSMTNVLHHRPEEILLGNKSNLKRSHLEMSSNMEFTEAIPLRVVNRVSVYASNEALNNSGMELTEVLRPQLKKSFIPPIQEEFKDNMFETSMEFTNVNRVPTIQISDEKQEVEMELTQLVPQFKIDNEVEVVQARKSIALEYPIKKSPNYDMSLCEITNVLKPTEEKQKKKSLKSTTPKLDRFESKLAQENEETYQMSVLETSDQKSLGNKINFSAQEIFKKLRSSSCEDDGLKISAEMSTKTRESLALECLGLDLDKTQESFISERYKPAPKPHQSLACLEEIDDFDSPDNNKDLIRTSQHIQNDVEVEVIKDDEQNDVVIHQSINDDLVVEKSLAQERFLVDNCKESRKSRQSLAIDEEDDSLGIDRSINLIEKKKSLTQESLLDKDRRKSRQSLTIGVAEGVENIEDCSDIEIDRSIKSDLIEKKKSLAQEMLVDDFKDRPKSRQSLAVSVVEVVENIEDCSDIEIDRSIKSDLIEKKKSLTQESLLDKDKRKSRQSLTIGVAEGVENIEDCSDIEIDRSIKSDLIEKKKSLAQENVLIDNFNDRRKSRQSLTIGVENIEDCSDIEIDRSIKSDLIEKKKSLAQESLVVDNFKDRPKSRLSLAVSVVEEVEDCSDIEIDRSINLIEKKKSLAQESLLVDNFKNRPKSRQSLAVSVVEEDENIEDCSDLEIDRSINLVGKNCFVQENVPVDNFKENRKSRQSLTAYVVEEVENDKTNCSEVETKKSGHHSVNASNLDCSEIEICRSPTDFVQNASLNESVCSEVEIKNLGEEVNTKDDVSQESQYMDVEYGKEMDKTSAHVDMEQSVEAVSQSPEAEKLRKSISSSKRKPRYSVAPSWLRENHNTSDFGSQDTTNFGCRPLPDEDLSGQVSQMEIVHEKRSNSQMGDEPPEVGQLQLESAKEEMEVGPLQDPFKSSQKLYTSTPFEKNSASYDKTPREGTSRCLSSTFKAMDQTYEVRIKNRDFMKALNFYRITLSVWKYAIYDYFYLVAETPHIDIDFSTPILKIYFKRRPYQPHEDAIMDLIEAKFKEFFPTEKLHQMCNRVNNLDKVRLEINQFWSKIEPLIQSLTYLKAHHSFTLADQRLSLPISGRGAESIVVTFDLSDWDTKLNKDKIYVRQNIGNIPDNVLRFLFDDRSFEKDIFIKYIADFKLYSQVHKTKK